jgi:RNA polymerase sigma factor (sigma-70 family)
VIDHFVMKRDRMLAGPGPGAAAAEWPTVAPVPGPDASDAAQLARSRLDPEAFTGIYDRYFPVIHRYVAGRLGFQAADDLAAEAFLVAFRKRGRFDPARGAVRPWLFGIATNLIAQHRRAEVRRYQAMARSGPEPPAESHEGSVVASLSGPGLRPELARALAALSQGERDVVLLSALGELSHEEIARALAIPDGTVRSRLHRARTKLRAALDHQEGFR